MTYEVLLDPLEPTPTWRVLVGEFFAIEKFATQGEALRHAQRLETGVVAAELGPRPMRVKRDVILDLPDAVLVRTEVQHEAFTFTTILGDAITWDVTRARDHVTRGNVVGFSEIPVSTLAEIAALNAWQEDVVATADPTQHGIAAPIVAMGHVIYVLIDGTHRAVRALRDHVPFSAWLLNDVANRDCVVRAPNGLIP